MPGAAVLGRYWWLVTYGCGRNRPLGGVRIYPSGSAFTI